MKEYPEQMAFSDVWKYFENQPLIHLATIENDQPRVRLMSITAHKGKLWSATKTHWDKVAQIEKNPKIEFTMTVRNERGWGCLRATGNASIVRDPETKAEISKAIPWFSSYWPSSTDPSFTLLQLNLDLIRFDNNDDGKKYTITIP
jgi:general stress protein 26